MDYGLRKLGSVLAGVVVLVGALVLPGFGSGGEAEWFAKLAVKGTPEMVMERLKAGNERFVAGKSTHPHADAARLAQAGTEDQGDHAVATVITCSDSRVPVELLFDQGVMDIFVIRVAGNVVRQDEAGSIEYGMAHVNTPLMVVLGHTQCGAVTAVLKAAMGQGGAVECNIAPLIAPIRPAVARARAEHPEAKGLDAVPHAVEQNVRQSMRDLFHLSPTARLFHASGKGRVVGAIYDVSTGQVHWLDPAMGDAILAEVEADPQRVMERMAR